MQLPESIEKMGMLARTKDSEAQRLYTLGTSNSKKTTYPYTFCRNRPDRLRW